MGPDVVPTLGLVFVPAKLTLTFVLLLQHLQEGRAGQGEAPGHLPGGQEGRGTPRAASPWCQGPVQGGRQPPQEGCEGSETQRAEEKAPQVRWEWLHPRQGTQLWAQGWLLCPTATSGALGTGLGRGHTLLSLCLAVTVPLALPWGIWGHLAPALCPLATAPGVTRLALLGDSPWGDHRSIHSSPSFPQRGCSSGGHPWARVVTEVAELWCLCPEQLLRDSRVKPQSEAAQGCVMHLAEVKEPCWHCHVPFVPWDRQRTLLGVFCTPPRASKVHLALSDRE